MVDLWGLRTLWGWRGEEDIPFSLVPCLGHHFSTPAPPAPHWEVKVNFPVGVQRLKHSLPCCLESSKSVPEAPCEILSLQLWTEAAEPKTLKGRQRKIRAAKGRSGRL